MAEINENYILACLANGFNTSQIAEGLGQTQSAVTQYIESHDLRNKAALKGRYNNIDSRYDNLEHKVMDKLEHALQYQECTPTQLSVILARVNGAKRRSLSEGMEVNQGAQLVQISIPKHLKVDVVLSAQNEVVSIGEREINTLSLANVNAMAAKRNVPLPSLIDGNNLFNLQKTAKEV